MSLWLLGVDRPGEVEVTSMLALPDKDLDVPLDLSLVMRTGRDQLATVSMSYNCHVNLYDYVLIGVEDTLVVDNGVLRNRDGVLYDPKEDQSEEKSAGLLQNREFVSAIRERRQPAISADAVLPALDVLQQAQNADDDWRRDKGSHPIR
jgi:hypothetical protein